MFVARFLQKIHLSKLNYIGVSFSSFPACIRYTFLPHDAL